MKIYIISDTHRNTEPIKNILKKNAEDIDLVIHLGDCTSDAEDIDRILGITPLIYVSGNNDPPTSLFSKQAPEARTVTLEGKKFYICHGHRLSVKNTYENLFLTAEKYNYDIVLFGHTHIPWCENRGNVTIFNPGTAGVPTARGCTYGVIDIHDDMTEFEIREVTI